MKFFTLVFTLLMTSQAFAHTDHVLGEGALHLFYHGVFWTLCVVVAVKAFAYFKAKRKQKTNK